MIAAAAVAGEAGGGIRLPGESERIRHREFWRATGVVDVLK